MSSASIEVTPDQIIEHRRLRKNKGLVGCKDGSDWPLDSLRGISWRPADPMNPGCFCYDCRDSWDSDGTIDAELIKNGNQDALWTYSSLLPEPFVPPPPPPPSSLARPINLLPRTDGWGWRGPEEEVMAATATPPSTPKIQIPPRTEPDYSISLPAPRHRDIMNEDRQTRIKKDLLEILTDFRSEMIDIMDSRRTAIYKEDDGSRCKYLEEVEKRETIAWEKIHAAELLIRVLDA